MQSHVTTPPSAQNSTSKALKRRLSFDPWSLGALFVASVVLAPILAVVWIAFHPVENIDLVRDQAVIVATNIQANEFEYVAR